MTDDDFGTFVGRLTRLAEVLDASLTPGRIAGYVEALQDLSLDDLVTGISASARESPFFPKPSELRERAEAATRARKQAALQAVLDAQPEPAPVTQADLDRNEAAYRDFVARARVVLRSRRF